MNLVSRLALALCIAMGPAATVGGNRAPDGTEIDCDLPGELHRKNVTSRGEGCCTWTAAHHAGLWQNIPAIQEAPKWIQERGMPGGAGPSTFTKLIPQMARDKGWEPPPFLNYQGKDLELLKLACKTGRMPCVVYSWSPSGRYKTMIAHMVNLCACTNQWACVLDNNYPGADQYEWMSLNEFYRTWQGNFGGWAVIFLGPSPPPPPKNAR
jgi:hypothetical protein